MATCRVRSEGARVARRRIVRNREIIDIQELGKGVIWERQRILIELNGTSCVARIIGLSLDRGLACGRQTRRSVVDCLHLTVEGSVWETLCSLQKAVDFFTSMFMTVTSSTEMIRDYNWFTCNWLIPAKLDFRIKYY